MNNLLPVKNKLYDILRLDPEVTDPAEIRSEQNLGVSITKAIAKDKPIIIFQQKNVFIQQTFNIVAEILEMLDTIERSDPETYQIMIPETAEEGEEAFKGLAEFCMLCLKRGASWKQYKEVVQEAYMRTVIKNSRTWSEAAERLQIQRTAIHRMATRMGVTDKPLDRRD